jgi:polyhydroxyalkanoate synthase
LSIAAEEQTAGAGKLEDEDHQLDSAFNATLARMTGGISPIALSLAFLDWASHLAAAPQRQLEIVRDAMRSACRLSESALRLAGPHRVP